MNLHSLPVTLGPGAFTSKSTASVKLGTVGYDRFGNKYRYVKAGASALVVGNVLQSSAQNTAHQNLTPTATSVGATSFVAALGASAATADLYKDGYAYITTTPGLGLRYVIKQHDAIASSGSGPFNLAEDTPIQVALTTTSRVSLTRNPCSGVIQMPATTLTGAFVGVAVYAIAANEYGWVGVNGEFPVLISGTPAVGAAVGFPSGVAGSVVIDGAATSGLFPLGVMMETGVDTRVQMVRVTVG
jgi:hypothetical protein